MTYIKTSKYKHLQLIFFLILLCSYSSTFALPNIGDTPCKKGFELSQGCAEYTNHLSAKDLSEIAGKIYWQYVAKSKPDDYKKVTAFREKLIYKSASLGYVPAIFEKASILKSSGQLKLAEENYRKAGEINGKTYFWEIEKVRQLRYLRYILFASFIVALAIIYLPIIRKRKWEKFRHRTLILTPYFVITLFASWFAFGSPDGRMMSPVIHKIVNLIDIKIIFFSAPFLVGISYLYLISKHLISKRLVIINLIILALVYVGILLLGFALAPLAS